MLKEREATYKIPKQRTQLIDVKFLLKKTEYFEWQELNFL